MKTHLQHDNTQLGHDTLVPNSYSGSEASSDDSTICSFSEVYRVAEAFPRGAATAHHLTLGPEQPLST
jgi:hypothetical protein